MGSGLLGLNKDAAAGGDAGASGNRIPGAAVLSVDRIGTIVKAQGLIGIVDGDNSGFRRVLIGLCHRVGGIAGFGAGIVAGAGDSDGDGLADVGLRQFIGFAGNAGNHFRTALPLIGDGLAAIVGGGEGLAKHRAAADGHITSQPGGGDGTLDVGGGAYFIPIVGGPADGQIAQRNVDIRTHVAAVIHSIGSGHGDLIAWCHQITVVYLQGYSGLVGAVVGFDHRALNLGGDGLLVQGDLSSGLAVGQIIAAAIFHSEGLFPDRNSLVGGIVGNGKLIVADLYRLSELGFTQEQGCLILAGRCKGEGSSPRGNGAFDGNGIAVSKGAGHTSAVFHRQGSFGRTLVNGKGKLLGDGGSAAHSGFNSKGIRGTANLCGSAADGVSIEAQPGGQVANNAPDDSLFLGGSQRGGVGGAYCGVGQGVHDAGRSIDGGTAGSSLLIVVRSFGKFSVEGIGLTGGQVLKDGAILPVVRLAAGGALHITVLGAGVIADVGQGDAVRRSAVKNGFRRSLLDRTAAGETAVFVYVALHGNGTVVGDGTVVGENRAGGDGQGLVAVDGRAGHGLVAIDCGILSVNQDTAPLRGVVVVADGTLSTAGSDHCGAVFIGGKNVISCITLTAADTPAACGCCFNGAAANGNRSIRTILAAADSGPISCGSINVSAINFDSCVAIAAAADS